MIFPIQSVCWWGWTSLDSAGEGAATGRLRIVPACANAWHCGHGPRGARRPTVAQHDERGTWDGRRFAFSARPASVRGSECAGHLSIAGVA